MTEETHPLARLTDELLQSMLRRAVRNTLILGVVASAAVGLGSGWRSAAMLAVGMLISAASILEWKRLVSFINAKMDKQQTSRGGVLAAVFFVCRLIIFGAAIYGSLKCLRGSPIALACGLGLAAAAILWEAIGLLRD